MSTSDVTHLQKQIEEKKKQLRQLVKAYGYTDPIVLASSQELDQFVYAITLLEQLNVKNDSNSSIELESHYTYVLYILP
ncbi:aspartyl-phosphate phosphatase Spo0E family protein [Bacillus sp. L_1B0_5]|uniref:aspartyl-phosphate phosphatase Spo0E family protein n=1 Tax=Bacillus sp. L_1B0_5 TaxID=1586646 RepID=UPI000B2F644B|nr:aspartyl-phosphate phosphatase Spo0E family protein [Bacillus sp. L_1B0_5]